MKVVVTGGAGFIGSHLVGELIKQGYSVVIVDNLSTGKMENLSNCGIFFPYTITDIKMLKLVFEGADIVLHLAATSNLPMSIDPISTFKINVTGTLNVLEVARLLGVKRVIFVSSSSVYGDTVGIQNEVDPTLPVSLYGWSKLIGEQCCQMYNELYSLSTVCLRYFNVFGERDPIILGRVIPRFIDYAKNNKPLLIYGNGEQTRDFIFIDDVVKATILLMKSDVVGIFNVGSGIGTSINRLAELVIKLTGSKSIINHLNPREGDPKHTLANINKIKRLGFTPSWSVEDGLRRMISANC